jgi:hypothetical protein
VDKITEAVQSRCISIDFKFQIEEEQSARMAFAMRVRQILHAEGASLDSRRLAEIVVKWFPEFRQIL